MSYPRYICTVCNYVQEAPQAPAPMSIPTSKTKNLDLDLAADFHCPTCNAGAEMFEGCTCVSWPLYEETKVHNDKHICTACNYIYDDATENRPFAQLPDNWTCPKCSMEKEIYSTCTCVTLN